MDTDNSTKLLALEMLVEHLVVKVAQLEERANNRPSDLGLEAAAARLTELAAHRSRHGDAQPALDLAVHEAQKLLGDALRIVRNEPTS